MQPDLVEPAHAASTALHELPSPRGWPLLGNALELAPERLHLVLEAWQRELGPRFVVRAGPRRMLVVTDTKLHGEMLRSRPHLYRRVSTIANALDALGITGVFSAEGSAWKPQRRLAMEALAPKNLRTFYPTLLEILGRQRARWQRAADEGRVLDLLDEFRRVTVDVTTRLVFGHDLDTLGSADKDPVSILIEPLLPGLNRRLAAFIPYWRWIRLPRDRHFEESTQQLREWLGERLARARRDLAAYPERRVHPQNFLEAMLVATDEHGAPFSEPVIIGNALTMLVAGEDTTANTLAWAVHHLCDLPEVRATLREEADAHFGEGDGPSDLEATNALTYAGAITQETMRLRPVAPLLFLEPTRDVVLDDIAVPRGTTIILLTRPPAVSTDVADATRFWPERWLPSTRGEQRFDTSRAIPFGSGPRICPGRSLALLEMRLVLANVARHFELERVTAAGAVGERFAFSMTPTELAVRVRRRP